MGCGGSKPAVAETTKPNPPSAPPVAPTPIPTPSAPLQSAPATPDVTQIPVTETTPTPAPTSKPIPPPPPPPPLVKPSPPPEPPAVVTRPQSDGDLIPSEVSPVVTKDYSPHSFRTDGAADPEVVNEATKTSSQPEVDVVTAAATAAATVEKEINEAVVAAEVEEKQQQQIDAVVEKVVEHQSSSEHGSHSETSSTTDANNTATVPSTAADSSHDEAALLAAGGTCAVSMSVLPTCGFVIKCHRASSSDEASPSNKVKVFINLLYHDLVATLMAAPIKTSVDKGGKECMSYDVIIPQKRFYECIQDEFLREQLCLEVIHFVNAVCSDSLKDEYILPKMKRGFVGDSIDPIDIPYTLLVTHEHKHNGSESHSNSNSSSNLHSNGQQK